MTMDLQMDLNLAKAQFRFLFVLQVWILRALSISSWKEAVNGTSLFPELNLSVYATISATLLLFF